MMDLEVFKNPPPGQLCYTCKLPINSVYSYCGSCKSWFCVEHMQDETVDCKCGQKWDSAHQEKGDLDEIPR